MDIALFPNTIVTLYSRLSSSLLSGRSVLGPLSTLQVHPRSGNLCNKVPVERFTFSDYFASSLYIIEFCHNG